MDGQLEAYSEKVKEFIRRNDNFTVLYHLDCDGIVSAVFLKEVIEKFGRRVEDLRAANYEDFDKLDTFSMSDSVIVCDIEIKPEDLDAFSGKNLCVIDHHRLVGVEKEGWVLYVNPKLWGDSRYIPCSLLEYEMFGSLLPGLDWLAAVGLISDSGGKENSGFVKSVASKYNIKLKEDEFLFQNDLGKAADMINSMVTVYRRKGAATAVKLLSKIKSMDELLQSREFAETYEKLMKESERLSKKFEKEKSTIGAVEFFENSRSDKVYSSTLITALSHSREHYGRVIVFLTDIDDDKIRVNVRANGVDISIPEILKRIFKIIPGEGGGHDRAAGATINYSDRERFKREFSRIANEMLTRSS
ncbi:MAG: DHH family phosphoesterase [Thermoplasmatales archaeon]